MKLVEIILTVETRLFFFLVEIFKIETFQSRFSCVKIVIQTVKIFIQTVEIFETYWEILTNLNKSFWGTSDSEEPNSVE